MSLNAEQRTARARGAAYRRWHPSADPAKLEQDRIRRHIAAIDDAGRRGTMSAETRDLLSRLFHYGAAPESTAPQ
jgi:hypothetical protein